MKVAGNAARDGVNHRQWFLGPFLDETTGRRTDHLEIKWGTHPKGQTRESWSPGAGMTTISILVRGRFRIDFRDPNMPSAIEPIVLREEGDYVLWTSDVEHTWQAEEDSVVVTVRWPENRIQ